MKKLKPNEYRCANCNKVYQYGWSEEEANKEAETIFGKHPDDWLDDKVVVCDDCFRLFDPLNNPKAVAYAKKRI